MADNCLNLFESIRCSKINRTLDYMEQKIILLQFCRAVMGIQTPEPSPYSP